MSSEKSTEPANKSTEPANKSTEPANKSTDKINLLKKKLEQEGMEKVAVLKQNNLPLEENLTAIMQKGYDTFKKETGQGMTYSEMREMYG